MDFVEFPKMARLTREVVITEKIDGTNAQIYIFDPAGLDMFDIAQSCVAADRDRGLAMAVGSRTQYITPTRDNFSFAAWVKEHADELWALGAGRHFGEWWGSGIQRGYGLPKGEKRFSLFNTNRWGVTRDVEKYPDDAPACCSVVPVLYKGLFHEAKADNYIAKLAHEGSVAAPGFMDPEGVVVFHTASNTMFKKTVKKDDTPKSRAQ